VLQLGEIVDGKYEIVSALGRGGFAAVYKARHLKMDRFVALKCLDGTLLQQPEGPARFEREAKALHTLRHKNIIGFYGYGVWNEAPYMVMEVAEGTALYDILRNNTAMPCDRAIKVITQVLEALGAAHRSGIIHRDLKPSNIILDADDNVKVIDFGLSKFAPGFGLPAQRLTETGLTVGSCHYMAPEQALGGDVDQRVDIYAAGCILYEMLAGKQPFDADEQVAVMYMHLNNEPPPLATEPASIAVFVQNCMAKEPANRYADCDSALADLRGLLRGNQVVSAPSTVRRKHSPALIVSCISCVLIAGLIFLTLTPQTKTKQKTARSPQTSAVLLKDLIGEEMLRVEKVPAHKIQQVMAADDSDHLLPDSTRFVCYAFMARVHANRHQPFKGMLNKAGILYPQVRRFTDAYWVMEYGKLLEEDNQFAKAATIFSAELAEHTFGNPEIETDVTISAAKDYLAINEPDKAMNLMQVLIDRQKLSPEYSSDSRKRTAAYMTFLKNHTGLLP
jgi:serine/threonine protein kinase